MVKTLKISKLLIKEMLGSSFGGRRKKSGSKNMIIAFAVIMLSVFGMSFGPLAYAIGEAFAKQDAAAALAKIILPIGFLLIFFLSIFTNLSVFFLSGDIKKLLHLPVQPWQLLLAKLLSSFIYTIFSVFLFLGPILIGIGIGADYGVLYYLYSLICIILIPVIPTILTAIITTIVMRFANLAKSKDQIIYITMFLILGLTIGIQILANRYLSDEMMANMNTDIISQYSATGDRLNDFFFFLKPLTYALNHYNSWLSPFMILIYITLILLFVGLFLFIGQKIYIKAVLAGKNLGIKKNKNTKIKEKKHKSLARSYIAKEWRIIWRTPIYNLNLFIVNFIIIIVFIISFWSTSASLAKEGINLLTLTEYIRVDLYSPGSVLIFLAIVIFFTSFSMISSTAISREGRHALFMKYIPVSPIFQINAKIFLGVLIPAILVLGLHIACVILSIMSIFTAIALFIPSIGIILLCNYFGILIDLKRPKLNWSNENQAVKQNLNAFIAMICEWILFVVLLVSGIMMILNKNDSLLFSIIICFGTSTLTYAMCWGLILYFNHPKNDIFKKVV